MLTDKIYPIISNEVKTIDERYLIPKAIDTVRQPWPNDEVQLLTKKLNNFLYYTDSPVHILSTTKLDKPINDDE